MLATTSSSLFPATHIRRALCRRKLCALAARLAAAAEALSSGDTASHVAAVNVASMILEGAVALAHTNSMARSDVLQFCCDCAVLPLASPQSFLGSSDAAAAGTRLPVHNQAAAVYGLFHLARIYGMLDDFVARLDGARLSIWLWTTADSFQAVHGLRPKGAACSSLTSFHTCS